MKLADYLFICATLWLGSWFRWVRAGTFDIQLNSVENNMSLLDEKLSKLHALAEESGHSHIAGYCQAAKDSLQNAQSAWKNIASSYGDKPWLASDSPQKAVIEEYWFSCGTHLKRIYQHPHVTSDHGGYNSYSEPVEECKGAFETCHYSLQEIWNWPCPKPVPSGAYYKRSNIVRREVKLKNSTECPTGETACPISTHSSGFECIDINSELSSCGGCVSQNEGENCMDIPGAAGVGCHMGKCVVLSVQPSYFLGTNGRPLFRRKRFRNFRF